MRGFYLVQMDKRSVLVDALAYVSNIHDEMERIKKEEPKHSHNNCIETPTYGILPPGRTVKSYMKRPRPRPKPKSQILEVNFLDLISNVSENCDLFAAHQCNNSTPTQTQICSNLILGGSLGSPSKNAGTRLITEASNSPPSSCILGGSLGSHSIYIGITGVK